MFMFSNDIMEIAGGRDFKTIIVGQDALARHGLVAGYNCNNVYTPYKGLDKCPVIGGVLEHWHVHDDYQLTEIAENVFLPSAERAIVDCIIWQDHNYDEGFLIEALQSYQDDGHSVSDLYECADHYLVPYEVIDYWWNEALNESDVSMG